MDKKWVVVLIAIVLLVFIGLLLSLSNYTLAQAGGPTSDSGKQCTSDTDCEGRCIADEKGASEGQCSGVKNPKGCRTYFPNGKPDYYCID
jgi:hypothetical protein